MEKRLIQNKKDKNSFMLNKKDKNSFMLNKKDKNSFMLNKKAQENTEIGEIVLWILKLLFYVVLIAGVIYLVSLGKQELMA